MLKMVNIRGTFIAKQHPTHPKPPDAKRDETVFFGARVRWVLLGLIFLGALGVRLIGLDTPPVVFHPTRQFRSALLARSYYYQSLDHLPAWKIRVADRWKNNLGLLEPPIGELIASTIYRLSGAERLWLPRLLSVIYWLGGAVAIFLLAAKLTNTDGAMVSVAFYLFVPFGISASQSFQPDPLMMMLFLWSIFLMFQCGGKPSRRGFWLTTTASALAMLVKPICLFPIFTCFVGLFVTRHGLRQLFRRKESYAFALLSFLPTLLYYAYLYGMGGFIRSQSSASFLPHLLLSWDFWFQWFNLIDLVVGQSLLLIAILGIFLVEQRAARTVLLSLFLGYLVFGLTFTYHISTHDYYHLLLIPAVALSLGQFGSVILGRCIATCGHWLWRALATCVMLSLLLLALRQLPRHLPPHVAAGLINMAGEIGEAVHHSDNTVFLAHENGTVLGYYAEIAGTNWPSTDELNAQKTRGIQPKSAKVRFDQIMRDHSPAYFIITNSGELRQQKELHQLLQDRFPILKRSDTYLIYDLQTPQ